MIRYNGTIPCEICRDLILFVLMVKNVWPTNDAPPTVREATSSQAAWPGGEAPHRPFWAQRGLFCHHVRAGLLSLTRALNRAEQGFREQGGKKRGRRCLTHPHSFHMCWYRECKGCRQSLCLPKKTLCSRGSWWVLMLLQYKNIHPTKKVYEQRHECDSALKQIFTTCETELSKESFCQMEVSF